MKVAVYPGTFDPITYGHIDVIKKALNIFDKLIIATSDNSDKDYYFSVDLSQHLQQPIMNKATDLEAI